MKLFRNIWIVLSVGLSACSGFLDEIDQDKFIPANADHYAALLLQEFNYAAPVMPGVEMMTDEVRDTEGKIKLSGSRTSNKPLFTWQRDIELSEDGARISNNGAWKALYEDIAIANYVIELIDEAEGSRNEIDDVKGEACFIRAWCYFNLLNLYAEPYRDAAQAKSTYGVPLRLDVGVNTTYDKEMLYDGYAVVEKDLLDAKKYIAAGGLAKTIWHPSVKACDLLLSRVKLYKKEYAEVITLASGVMAGNSLKKLSQVNVKQPFITVNNPELLFSFSPGGGGGLSTLDLEEAGFAVNTELLEMYQDGDLRKSLFFEGKTDLLTGKTSVYPRKADAGYSSLGFCNFRVAEAYLNRAEAYAHTGNIEGARADMQELLANRYANPDEINIPAEKVALIAFIYNERFKELCFEAHHRWFDLRRMPENERPEITHRFTVVDGDGNKAGTEVYRLLRDDRNYTLSVPAEEKDNNPFIRDYERFDKMPDIVNE